MKSRTSYLLVAVLGIGIGYLAVQPWLGYPLLRLAEPLVTWAFAIVYYHSGETWTNMTWMGVPIQKYPTDLWVYQEILRETQPDVIVESGTFRGGSALYMANICDLLRKGRVLTIDVIDHPGRPIHPRIEYLRADSASREAETLIRARLRPEEKVMAILDSDHSKSHVARELEIYSRFVSKGAYLIVEDTNINGHPVHSTFGPGPMEAVDEFMRGNSDFVVDRLREKFKVTSHPKGYLRRMTARPPLH